MSEKIQQAWESTFKNLAASTGKSLEEWKEIVRTCGITGHKAIRDHLQATYGLGYGYANSIVQFTANDGISEDELVTAQYAGEKAALLPLYQEIIAAVTGFGEDVEISPKKTYVSLRRAKQFALLQPTTKSRLDVGIALKGVSPVGRLEAAGSFNAMVSHRVRLDAGSAVDDELIGWLKQAYDVA
jgi:hypothetical protein